MQQDGEADKKQQRATVVIKLKRRVKRFTEFIFCQIPGNQPRHHPGLQDGEDEVPDDQGRDGLHRGVAADLSYGFYVVCVLCVYVERSERVDENDWVCRLPERRQ